jgi:NAD(P)-dependent dehydrogenase (short-subunit alcohol dehydrogenase family)
MARNSAFFRRCKSLPTAPIFVAWSSIAASIAPDRESSAMSKTILITGASRGIGRATSLLAGQRGWSVGINYLKDSASAKSAAAEVERAGGKAVAVAGDVSHENDVIAMFQATKQALGPLDGVVVNAGVGAPSSRLVDMTVERMRQVFEVNVLGAYLVAREAARSMIKSSGGNGGSIVLISSVAARIGAPDVYVDYAGSKAAVDAMALGLSKELGREGVRVNSIRPGVIETEIHATYGEPDRPYKIGASTPLGRPGTANEIAEAIVWLLSDASSYVTGAIIDVTGGR